MANEIQTQIADAAAAADAWLIEGARTRDRIGNAASDNMRFGFIEGFKAAGLRGEAAQSPSYDALQIIVQSMCGALERAGITDCDDPGEAIDVMRERYEARITELSAQGEQQAVAWQTRAVSVVTGEIVESWRGCSQKDFDKTGGAPYVWEDVLRIEFRALYECPQPVAVAGDAVREIVSDIRHSAKVDDYEAPQIAFLESVADRLAALSAAPAAPGKDGA